MKLKRLFILLCTTVMLWSIPTFAADIDALSQKYVQKQLEVRDGTLTFFTMGNDFVFDCRCQPELYITIKEEKAGILKNGDIIYFETTGDDGSYFVSEGLMMESKGLSVHENYVPTQQKDNHFSILISRNKQNEKIPAEINIHFSPYWENEAYIDGTISTDKLPTFSLWLDADKTKENNLFAGEQNILLNDHFMKSMTFYDASLIRRQQAAQKMQQELPELLFFADKNTMTWDGVQKQLKHNVIINQNGTAMLSLEDFINMTAHLEKYGVISEKAYSKDTKEYFIKSAETAYQLSLESNTIKALNSDRQTFENALEQKEDVTYISLRAIAYILNMENNITWDNNTKTITITKSKAQ